MLIIRHTYISHNRSGVPKWRIGRKDWIQCLGLKMWRSFISKSKHKTHILLFVMCLFQKCLDLWFCFVATSTFLHCCKQVDVWGSGLYSVWFFFFFFFFSSEMVKCLPNAKPAPKAQLVCSKTGGIESCFLSCPSNTLFVPGLYRVFVLLSLGCDLMIFLC